MVWSTLKHFLRTRSDDAWSLIEFTPREKQKCQVTSVTKHEISRFICIQQAHALFQTSRSTENAEVNPIYEYFLLFYRRINMAVLHCSHTINIYNKKFDWLFIVDPFWLVWNTYISHSLTDWVTHPSTHNILDAPTTRYFLAKNNSKMKAGAGWFRTPEHCKKINEHRITARKDNETPSPQHHIFSAMIRLSTLKIIVLYLNNFPQNKNITTLFITHMSKLQMSVNQFSCSCKESLRDARNQMKK